MRLFIAAPAILLLAPIAAQAQALPIPREINITSDSAPGWLPSVEQDQAVARAGDAYFAALERGDYAAVYAMMAEPNRATGSTKEFSRMSAEMRNATGALLGRTVLKVTWTKDPANAPASGVYAAVDISARYANADRHCGYQIWYQKPEGGPFLLMRSENVFIDNESAARIAKKQSPAELDRLWAQMSSHCPNYRPAG